MHGSCARVCWSVQTLEMFRRGRCIFCTPVGRWKIAIFCVDFLWVKKNENYFASCRRSTTIAKSPLAWDLSPLDHNRKMVQIEYESLAGSASSLLLRTGDTVHRDQWMQSCVFLELLIGIHLEYVYQQSL